MSIAHCVRRALTLSAACGALSLAAQAQFTLSKVFVNPPGADNGQEVIEIRGPASTALAGYWLLAIEGDGTGAGVVDVAYSLDTAATGSNGILLVRDGASVINPPPDAATGLFVSDFNPDIENGSNTFVLGFGTPPATTTDLDTDNDGTLDVTLASFGFTVVDALALIENDGAANVAYADDLGFANFGPIAAFNADVLVRVYNEFDGSICNVVGCDVIGVNPNGPYSVDFPRAEGFAAHGLDGSTPIEIAFGSVMSVFDVDGDGFANACDPLNSYCTSGVSLAGCTPTIRASGVPSVSAANGFVISVDNADADRAVQIFYSVSGVSSTPFGAGFLCIATPRQRMGMLQNSGGTPGLCDGSVSRDLQDWALSHPAALGMPFVSGATLYFQGTVRDAGNVKNRVMTDAFFVTLLP